MKDVWFTANFSLLGRGDSTADEGTCWLWTKEWWRNGCQNIRYCFTVCMCVEGGCLSFCVWKDFVQILFLWVWVCAHYHYQYAVPYMLLCLLLNFFHTDKHNFEKITCSYTSTQRYVVNIWGLTYCRLSAKSDVTHSFFWLYCCLSLQILEVGKMSLGASNQHLKPQTYKLLRHASSLLCI